ncbi:MAG: serine protease [bacterium]|nr:serine protease [bacterium]
MDMITNESTKTVPYVCNAVRTVGVIKPQFNPQTNGFLPPQLTIKGTGFWLKDKKAFITCAHVVQDILGAPIEVAGMLVVGGNGVAYKKTTVSILDFVHDLAVLNVEADDGFLQQQISAGLDICERTINVGDQVAYAGFPFGNALLNTKHTPTYAEGLVGTEILEDTLPKTIQISGAVAGGYSGAPIVLKNDQMKIIAVLANSISKDAGGANIFRGIHWKHLKELFELIKS